MFIPVGNVFIDHIITVRGTGSQFSENSLTRYLAINEKVWEPLST